MSVRMVLNGEDPVDVAEEFGVSERSIWRWLSRWRQRRRQDGGVMAVRPGRGRPRKLDEAQAAEVLHWLDRPASEFGFLTERWTAPRVAEVIRARMDVQMNHRYLNSWLRARGITPQVPPRVAREKNEAVIEAWRWHVWPGIKKK